MDTQLDICHALQLEGYCYDGNSLVAEVSELVVGPRRNVVQGDRRYLVTFRRPVSHAVTEEFPAALATWIRGTENGFLRRLDNESLVVAMGLNESQFSEFRAFALITAHEILVAFCAHEPEVTLKGA